MRIIINDEITDNIEELEEKIRNFFFNELELSDIEFEE